MTLKVRVIPVLLCSGSQLVKGEKFGDWKRSTGLAMQAARIHQTRNVDELIVIDVTATPQRRAPDLPLIRDLAKDCFMPLSIGGGVRHINQVRDLLSAGADKVILGTAAHEVLGLLTAASNKFGSQAIVVSVDADDKGSVYVRCGKQNIMCDAEPYAVRCEELGAGEIFLNSISRDGMMEGYDIPLIERVSKAVGVPVIACGGAGTYEHMAEALRAGAHAVAAGAMFLFTDATPRGASEYLATQGFSTRLVA